MDITGKQLMVVAGEPSGDERAAEVIHNVRKQAPDVHFFGIGGPNLRSEGMEILVDISQTAVIGVYEAIARVFYFRKIMLELMLQWKKRRPVGALLVDFGGFNLRLAKQIKKVGGRTAYYISPQVWASRPGRARKVRDYVDLMMVLFDFEVEFYKQYDVEAIHVGHPLVDSVVPSKSRTELFQQFGFDPDSFLVGIMPGSRESEIRSLLPVISQAMDILAKRGIAQFVVIAAPGRRELLESLAGDDKVTIVEKDKYSWIAASDIVIMASGTAALEAAMLATPGVVLYKTSALTAMLAKILVNVPNLSLPNLILGEKLYPELLQKDCTPDAIVRQVLDILEDSNRYDRIRRRLTVELPGHLGSGGAAERAAGYLIDFLELG
jgi:lipid-A-disaccharide synthase